MHKMGKVTKMYKETTKLLKKKKLKETFIDFGM